MAFHMKAFKSSPKVLLQIDAHRLDSQLSIVLAVVGLHLLLLLGPRTSILLIVQFRQNLLVEVRVPFYVLRIHVIIGILVAGQAVFCSRIIWVSRAEQGRLMAAVHAAE